MRDVAKGGTIRLVVPQWQGGESRAYPLGARLLQWLAPESAVPTYEISVAPPQDMPLALEAGVAGRTQLAEIAAEIRAILQATAPERIVVFGGDCLVTQEPFAYLNARHQGKLGLLWLDTHPDVALPTERFRGHTMVLGNLLGAGEPEMAASVAVPFAGSHVMMVGLGRLFDYETERLAALGVRRVDQTALEDLDRQVLEWVDREAITHIAVHLDLDVLDPAIFRAQGFSIPGVAVPEAQAGRTGRMNFAQLGGVLALIERRCEVVGFGMTEHLPWDMLNLQDMMAQVAILKT